jgi:hypothetical protein
MASPASTPSLRKERPPPAVALEAYRRLWTDGLQRLYMISAMGWTADGLWPPRTIPIVPDGHSSTPDFFTRLRQFEPTPCC